MARDVTPDFRYRGANMMHDQEFAVPRTVTTPEFGSQQGIAGETNRRGQAFKVLLTMKYPYPK